MINKEIPEKIEQIRLDRWRGASELAREALLVFKFAVEVSREERVEVFLEGKNLKKGVHKEGFVEWIGSGNGLVFPG